MATVDNEEALLEMAGSAPPRTTGSEGSSVGHPPAGLATDALASVVMNTRSIAILALIIAVIVLLVILL